MGVPNDPDETSLTPAEGTSPLSRCLAACEVKFGDLEARLVGSNSGTRAELSYIDLVDIHKRNLEFSELPLETAVSIASALDVPAAFLLQFDQESAEVAVPRADNDARTLLAILDGSDRQPVDQVLVEESTGWTADRLETAIRLANHHLAGTGMRISTDQNDRLVLRLTSTNLDGAAVAKFRNAISEKGQPSKSSDSFEVLSSLWPLVHGDMEEFRKTGVDPRSLDELVSEGVIEPFLDGYWFTPETIKLLDLELVTVGQMAQRRSD